MNEDHKRHCDALRDMLEQRLHGTKPDLELYEAVLRCIEAYELEPERLAQLGRLEEDNRKLREQNRKLRASYYKETGMSSKLREALRE